MATKIEIFKLEWYTEANNSVKNMLITNKEEATIRFKKLYKEIKKNATYDSAWIALCRMEEDNNFELKEVETLHYNEF